MLLNPAKHTAQPVPGPAEGRTAAVSHLPSLPPAELSFLLGLLSSLGGASTPAFPRDGNADLLWEYIERHGIGGVLGGCADRVAGLPPALAEAARHRYWSNCLHGRQGRQRCAALLEAGRRTGVPFVFVKGPALAEQGYGDDGLRGFSDLDLFTANAGDARQLIRASGAQMQVDSEQQGIIGEIYDAGRVLAELDGWPVEIRFPIAGRSDPLNDLFPGGKLPEVVWTPGGLPAPKPEWHFLFLMHHLIFHHPFGRFMWFLDLAALARRERAGMDWGRVVEEAGRLRFQESLSAAAGFCRHHVDPGFPEVPPPARAGWNRAFIQHHVRPEVILASTLSKQHVSAARRAWAVLHGACVYFLVADVPATGRAWDSPGWQWTAGRVGNVLTSRWRGSWGRWLGTKLATLLTSLSYLLARLLARVSTKKQSL